eukprot:Gb_14860 [translate_table: standard]
MDASRLSLCSTSSFQSTRYAHLRLGWCFNAAAVGVSVGSGAAGRIMEERLQLCGQFETISYVSFIVSNVVFSVKLRTGIRQVPSIVMQTVVLKVGMSCEGCVGAVKRVLNKMEGVESYDVSLKDQKVTVKGNVKPEAVLQTVSKTGKETAFWPQEEKEAPK